MATKKKFKFFDIVSYEAEEKWLREMHSQGWRLRSVSGPCIYRFEPCEKEDVIYQLDYNTASSTDTEQYVQMFRDCGWEYIQNYMGYSYFRKPVAQMKDGTEENIFCDNESRLDMLRRIFRGRLLVLIAIFLCIIVPQLFKQWNLIPEEGSGVFWVFAVLGALYAAIFARFAIRYRAVRKRLS